MSHWDRIDASRRRMRDVLLRKWRDYIVALIDSYEEEGCLRTDMYAELTSSNAELARRIPQSGVQRLWHQNVRTTSEVLRLVSTDEGWSYMETEGWPEWLVPGGPDLVAASDQDLMDQIEDEPVTPPTREPTSWMVDVYLVTRQWGGPEEGGWWYDAGVLVRDDDVLNMLEVQHHMPALFIDRKRAESSRRMMQEVLDRELNVHRRPLRSVLSTGVYQAMVHPELSPRHWPSQRPTYE